MGHRKQRKEQELQQVRDQSKTTQEKTARIKQDIAETRKIVDAQPISQEDIRRIRAESKGEQQLLSCHMKRAEGAITQIHHRFPVLDSVGVLNSMFYLTFADLGEHNGLLQRKIQETNDVIERQQGANRILQSDIEALCAEVASSLSTSNIPETMDRVTEIVGNMQESDRFLAKLEAEQDNLMKKVSPGFRSLQLFESFPSRRLAVRDSYFISSNRTSDKRFPQRSRAKARQAGSGEERAENGRGVRDPRQKGG